MFDGGSTLIKRRPTGVLISLINAAPCRRCVPGSGGISLRVDPASWHIRCSAEARQIQRAEKQRGKRE
jgi:hypothetical protein